MNIYQLAGEQRCCFETGPAYCGQPATVHVLLDEPGDHTLCCTEHTDWWTTNPARDQHPVMAVCGLPGSTWIYGELSTVGHTVGRCAVQGIGELAGQREATAERAQ